MSSFVIANPDMCIGCRTCEIACVVAHSEKNIFSSQGEIEFTPRLKVIRTNKVTAPVQCRHCKGAPCAKACPNNCISHNEDGVVCIDRTTCVGCKNCMIACPFGAIDMVPVYEEDKKVLQQKLKVQTKSDLVLKEKLVASKCDLCIGREGEPACVEKCLTKALKLIVTP